MLAVPAREQCKCMQGCCWKPVMQLNVKVSRRRQGVDMGKQHRRRCMATCFDINMSHIGHTGKSPCINKAGGYKATQTPTL